LTNEPAQAVDAEIVRALRHALHHLYDPGMLGKSLLVALFALERNANPATALRRLLLDAIHTLKPDALAPPQTKSWRAYQVLLQRFQEQATQQEVASDLGLSIRHLRRAEAQAVHLLAEMLWLRYGQPAPWSNQPQPAPQAEPAEPVASAETPGWQAEMMWLQESLPSEPVEVVDLLAAMMQLIRPLAQAAALEVAFTRAESLPMVNVQRTTLRQALLNVFTAAIRCAPGGRILIAANPRGQTVQVDIEVTNRTGTALVLGEDVTERLALAQQLSNLSSAVLTVTVQAESDHPLTARLSLPVIERIPVLVIDDNADTLQLLQRYLAHSRYRFIGVADPRQALLLAEKYAPQIIVLDVMLPEVDGWELLGRLREHPQIGKAPIIVSTILPQAQLAAALGAADFVRKPFNQQMFLAALERQFDRSVRESR
jgi:CheY-like chemotaxis protein